MLRYSLVVAAMMCMIGCQPQEMPKSAKAISLQDVEALIDNYTSALMQCDITAWSSSFHGEADAFPLTSVGLIGWENVRQSVTEQCNEGIKFDITATDVSIRAYDNVAVATYVLAGSRIASEADSSAVSARFTLVLSNKDGKLGIDHLHASPL